MRFSHSRVDLYKRCPYHFYIKYMLNATEIRELSASDPLIIGNALHYGLEVKDKQRMIDYYISQYPVLTNEIVHEQIKLEMAYDKVMPVVEQLNIAHQEYVIENKYFKGIVDLIIDNGDGTVDVFDFKYSNNVDGYDDSYQLHLYKDFLEDDGFKVNRLGYIFIPKTFIRQKKNEDLHQFRQRLITTYDEMKVTLKEVEYDEMASVYFINDCKEIELQSQLTLVAQKRNPKGECFQCKYKQDYLEIIEGEDGTMALPKNERRELELDLKPHFWIYADSYVGKSTFVDTFDNVLFINTDGNIDNITAPVVRIGDKVKKKGRIRETEFGWQEFKDTVDDLTNDPNDYEIVAIDLFEDLLELCRSYIFNKHNIEHESDSGFGKGWDLVRKEFVDTIKRLKALDYRIVFISKEIRKEIKEKSGKSYTTFSPNINDKQANIMSGVVSLTIHAEKHGDERIINLIPDEHTFGGGRFNFKQGTCALDRKAFEKALKDAQQDRVAKKAHEPEQEADPVEEESPFEVNDDVPEENTVAEDMQDIADDIKEDPPVKTRRRRRAGA